MDRREKIVFMCNLDGEGLEIGPSLRPVVPKRDGYNIETIDHTDKKGLQKKYAAEGYNVDDIEEVDYIWNGESYAELTGKKNHYDYVIASHVIEHTSDLVGFLRDCSDILKENGVLSLAVPDKRFCFDYLRPVTSISKVIDCHINSNVVHTPGSVYEHLSNACKSNNDLAWAHPHPPVIMSNVHKIQEAVDTYKESLNKKEYTDIHNWVFTMKSFELLIYDLNCLGLINMQIAASFETSEHEFLVTLVKSNELFVPDDEERFKLAVKAQLECDPLDPEDVFLKRQITALEENASKKEEQINMLEEHIKGIYNSKSWKIASKLQKLYRLFNPRKLKMEAD
ncbi:MAG: methyltransferase domain-containing protein [Oscillospiraceae bacterium]|nr:methyltransferase domain-containing protein [Oscillospiraceae bacterium]